MDYYKQTQYIAHVNEKDEIQGKVEKWEAHKKGILHRAFSVVLKYQNQYIMQMRKHPAFDGYIDVTCSSHPLYINEEIQPNVEAVYDCLKREWNIDKSELKSEPKKLGFAIYKADDTIGGFVEHELCYLFESEIEKLPTPDFSVAYGSLLLTNEELKNKNLKMSALLAPWVEKFIEVGLM